ncbi:MAG: TonB-dependent receptor [Gemmatimonadetes bacterium]|nr:TonB-dependent receptor [Gemmatimonadota bacterium]
MEERRKIGQGLVVAMLAVLGGMVPSTTAAQEGGVTGVVVDEATGLALGGARVEVQESGRAVVSNTEGRFVLLGIPSGPRQLVVTYLGYATESVSVEVVSGSIQSLRINLRVEALALEGVTATGQRRGQAAALNRQFTAPNITNVVAADQIGRFPDANIGDAIKRLPGVVVIQDQGEARFGLIRGTEPRLNSVIINGERIPSAEAEVREVQLDLLPADMIAAVEVSKALTPDMDADAIGGSVNLVTRSAPPGRRISGTLGSGYNFLSERGMSVGSAVLADRFANDRLGLIVSGSYFDHHLGSDNIEGEWDQGDAGAFLSEFQIREYQIQRTRRSLSAGLDYALADGHTLTWRSLYNHRDDWENRFRLVYALDEPGTDGTAVGELERQTKGGLGDDRIDNRRLEDQRIQSHSLSGEHLFPGGAALTWSAQWARASEERLNERYIQFVAEDVPVSVDTSNPRKPALRVVGAVDPSAFELDELTEETQFTRDQDTNVRVDLSLPVFGATEVKVGARLRDKSKLRDNNFFEFEPMSGLATLAEAATRDYTNSGFLAGDYPIGEFTTQQFLGSLDLGNLGQFDGAPVADEFIPANFDADERILAGYAMATAELSPEATLVAGLRVEQTDVDYTGFEFVEDDESSRALLGDDSYTNLFPSLHLRYSLGDRGVMRASWTNTLSRPNYYDLVPYRVINREDGELALGNPDLEPTTSMNFDLLFERYFQAIGIVSAGVFYKDINDFIFEYTVDDALDPVTGSVFSEVTQPQNGGGASLIGFEIGLHAYLGRGFSAYGNYTFTDSSVDGLPIAGRESEDLPLPGTSKHTANGSLAFENDRLSLRASVNFQDDFIDPGEVGDEAFFDRYYDRATTLDLNGSLIITPSARFFFEANNLTDQPLRYYQGTRARIMQEEFYDRRFQAGVKVDLR